MCRRLALWVEFQQESSRRLVSLGAEQLNNQPLVSVLIPVYNAGTYLRSAVESILGQTYKNIEVLIIDDGSTDRCMESIECLVDGRLRLLRQKNSGKSAALNLALDHIRGEYFAIQDADDLSYPQRVERQLDCLQKNPNLAAVFVGHDLLLGRERFAPTFNHRSTTTCKEDIKRFAIPAHDATGMYRVSMVAQMRFDKELRIGQGVDYVLRVGEQFSIMLLGECLYTYRINYCSTIRRDPRKTMESIILVVRKACDRRGIAYLPDKFLAHNSPVFLHREKDTHIVPHCMEGVLDLRRIGRRWESLKTAITCLKLNPLDPYYYKPLCYFFVSFKLIDCYRRWKGSRQR
jgi:glycosyltransferase involved in cell wall biosynthesis